MNYTYVDQDLQTFLKDNTSVSFMVEAAPTIPVYDATTVDGYGASNKVLDGSYTANVVGMKSFGSCNRRCNDWRIFGIREAANALWFEKILFSLYSWAIPSLGLEWLKPIRDFKSFTVILINNLLFLNELRKTIT